MAASEENFLFHSAVEHENQTHTLTLTKLNLSWEHAQKSRTYENQALEPLVNSQCCSVDLHDVIGVKPIKIPPKHSTLSLRKTHRVSGTVPVCIELSPIGPVGFSVYVVIRPGTNKWRYNQISFQCKDSILCQQWIHAIKDALRSKVLNRPQHLVVFLNPFSGKKKAVKIYREKVAPWFDLAEIKVDLIETQRQNHARDLIQESLDLKTTDGIVCVGGDGMFSEILNGLIQRTCTDNGASHPTSPQIRLGIIPAGSTNTIVFSTTGVCDPLTSALQIVTGDSLGLDVNSVRSRDQTLCYSVTLLGYGYMGDLLKDSENKRWMGPKRYDVSGTKAFISNNSYYGEVRFQLSPHSDQSHPSDKVRCYSGCETCRRAQDEILGNSGSDIEVNPEGEWKTIQGRFVAVNGVTMTCSCDLSPPGMSPYCHLGDGCIDLILVSQCSRTDFLRFLLRTRNGKERESLGCVQTYRVKEFSFHPLYEDSDMDDLIKSGEVTHSNRIKLKKQMNKTSVWNCDGEVISQPNITVRVHCQLVTLFARGIPDPSLNEDQKYPTQWIQSVPKRQQPLAEKDLARLCSTLGENWEFAMYDLGLTENEVWRAKQNHTSSVLMQIYDCLSQWRRKNYEGVNLEMFVRVMGNNRVVSVNWEELKAVAMNI